MSVLSENIKNRMWALNMTQEELAKKVGYKGRASINAIVNGEQNPPFNKIEAIAEALKTSPAILCGWDVPEDDADDGKHGFDLKVLANRLQRNEYDVEFFSTLDEATAYIIKRCKGKTVGLSDSVTLTRMKLLEKLCEVYGEENIHASQERTSINNEFLKKSITADVFILSVSAVSYKTGEMVNIGNVGHSIAGSLCDSGEVIFVINKNKIASNLEEAIHRARNVAAITATRKHGYRTPCVDTGKCEDCKSSDRYCRLMCIYYRKPKLSHVTIVLVDEESGY